MGRIQKCDRTRSSRWSLVLMACAMVAFSLPASQGWAATVFTVNTASDSDADCTPDECSLREAINAANQLPGLDTIAFNLPGDPPEPIRVTASVPVILDPVVIDGTTQPGYAGKPIVEVDGSLVNEPGAYAHGFEIWSGDSTIRGLVINDFEGSSGIRIRADVQPGGGHNNVIQNNYIGTSRDGLSAEPNYQGIAFSGGSRNNLIGGTLVEQRNVISGNYEGISIGPGDGSGTRIVGNHIGTDPTGNKAVGNTGQAIRVDGSGYTFGGPGPGEGNVISGNEGDGFEIVTRSAFDNTIQRNLIGVSATGAALGNRGTGVLFVEGPHDNLVGGRDAGTGNVIANNTYGGVQVGGATSNSILGNSIRSNDGLGIDLGVSGFLGVTPNDSTDADQGANDLQNYPIITSASKNGDQLTVKATLRSTPNSQFRVEFFDNDACDTSAFGEGAIFLGATSVATDDEGDATLTTSFPTSSPGVHAITATATNATGSTSEFSRCVEVAGASPDPGPTPSPTTPGPDARDVRIEQSVHHAGRTFPDPGPRLEGNPTIPDELWFVYDLFNESSERTVVTLRIHPDTFDYKAVGRGGYNHWTIPMLSDGIYFQGNPDCSSPYVCRIRLLGGQSYRVIVTTRANAPGPFSIYATISTNAEADDDLSNNRTPTFDRRVVCSINGTAAGERLVATPTPDSICGGDGNDVLVAVGKGDALFGQAGNDTLMGRPPANRQTFNGGPGRDTADFANSDRRVVVSLRDFTGGGRSLYSVEAAIGSRYGDYLTGLNGADRLEGGPGDDQIAGRAGRDVSIGGSGDDRFISLDGSFDSVSGGAGNDLCQADGGDRVASASRTSSAPFYLDP